MCLGARQDEHSHPNECSWPGCTPMTSARWPGEPGVPGAGGARAQHPFPRELCVWDHSRMSIPTPVGASGFLVLGTLWDLSPLATQPQPKVPLGCWAVLWGCSCSVPQQQRVCLELFKEQAALLAE